MADPSKFVGGLRKALEAAKAMPAAEREANLAKMLEPSQLKDRLYHGSLNDIKEFKPGTKGLLGPGTYLSPSPAKASGYAKFRGRIKGDPTGENVMPVYAQAENPYYFDNDPLTPITGEHIEKLKAMGHDAIILRDPDGNISEVNILNPRQIKSAIGNRGTYDIKEPDVNKADGGKIVGGLRKALEAASAAKKVPEAPSIIVPSKISELKKIVQERMGGYGAKRLERAADEIPGLDKLYSSAALKSAFVGDNARALMTMNSKDFEKYSAPIPESMSNPQTYRRYGSQSLDDSMKDMTLKEYIESLTNVPGGFADVPFLEINKKEQGLPLMPFISGHEGRHRSRALVNQGQEANLVRLLPRAELREPFPRRSQEEYIEALKKELEMTGNKVVPQKYEDIIRSAIELPDIYAKGGRVLHKVDGGKIAGGLRKALEASRRTLTPAEARQLIPGPKAPITPVLPAAEREAGLQKFLEPSTEKGRFYHGSKRSDLKQIKTGKQMQEDKGKNLDIEPWAVDNRGASFVSPSPEFASDFAVGPSGLGGYGPTMYPVRVQVTNPWDYDNPKHLKAATDKYLEMFPMDYDESNKFKYITDQLPKSGSSNWGNIENAKMQAVIEALGHDSFYVKEAGVKNLGIYDPRKIKSDTGNKGYYDVTKPDLNEAKGGVIHMADAGRVVGGLRKAMAAAKAPYSDKVLQSTADNIAEAIAQAQPKLPAAKVQDSAMKQAVKKLKWERVDKPAMQKRYGELSRSSYSDSGPEKLKNTPAVVTERMRKANEFLDIPTEPWQPPKPELQAFDRASIKDALEGFPGISQSAFPRDIPPRANISHVEELYQNPENRELIKKQIRRGLPLGGETFYASLYPVKQATLEAGMSPDKFEKWVHGLAPASARNSILNENAVGQFLRDMNARGIPLTEENVAIEMAKYKEKFGMGLPLMPVHRQGVASVVEGGQNLRDMSLANIPTNYKIPTYGAQKAGDFKKSVVLDVHEAGGQSQGSRSHPYFNEQGGFGNTEYNAGEQGFLGIANELGIPGGMAQAGRWFGGGELTGLVSPRGDALDLLEKQTAYMLKQKGLQPNPANVRKEILNQIKTGEGDLLPWYSRKHGIPDVRETGLQRKEGGSVTDPHKSFEEHRIKTGYEWVGQEVKKADGGLAFKTLDFKSAGGMAGGGKAEIPVDPDIKAPEKTSSNMDIIKRLFGMGKDQAEEEIESLKKPRAGTDLLNRGIIANLAGMPVDLVNYMGLGSIDALTSLQGNKTKLMQDKPAGGSEYIKDLMDKYGATTGTERPMMELAGAFAGNLPYKAVSGAAKAAQKVGEKAPEYANKAESGLKSLTSNVARPFTPGTSVVEAVSPDLATFRPKDFQNMVTERLIGDNSPLPLDYIGGKKTTKRSAQGVYGNDAGQLETNPMVAVDIPGIGAFDKNPAFRSDIASVGKALNQEAMAVHRFVPMFPNNIKDASAMLIKPKGGKLTNEEVIALGERLRNMVVAHNPRLGGVVVYPFDEVKKGVIPSEFLDAQSVANSVLGKRADIKYGVADYKKDRMFITRGEYADEGAREPSAQILAERKRLKKQEARAFPSPKPSSGLNQMQQLGTSTTR